MEIEEDTNYTLGYWQYYFSRLGGLLIYDNPLSSIFMIHVLFCMSAQNYQVTLKYLNK